ncbi:hypothetical protein KR093_006340, partial [Drosophila rubida]
FGERRFKIKFTIYLQKDAVIFKMTNAVCVSYNESWVVIHECRIRAVSRNKTIFNFNGTILHPAKKVTQGIVLFKKANGYKPWLLNIKIDCCKFMDKPYNPSAVLINNLFLEFSNIKHSCPYVGPQIVKGFYLRHEMLRLPFPTGEYLLAINWTFNRNIQFSTNVYFQYTEDY